MRFTNKNKELIKEQEVLNLLGKDSLEDITQNDIFTLLQNNILPIMNVADKRKYTHTLMSMWIDDNYFEGTLVGIIDAHNTLKEDTRKYIKSVENIFGILCLQGW